MCIGYGFFSASYGARHSALSVGLLDEVVLPKEETSILGVLSPQMFSKFFWRTFVVLYTSGNIAISTGIW